MTCVTPALEHGMDIKTLSAIIGHISSATTIDIYSHVTDTIQWQAATRIEDSCGNGEAFEANEATAKETYTDRPQEAVIKAFEPYKGKVR